MDAVVKVACIQAEPVVLDREATIDKLERLAAEAAGERRAAARLPGGVRPAYPSSVWAKALAGWAEPGATEAFALLAREAVAVPGDGRGADRRGGDAARRLDRHRRQRGRPRAALDALQHAPLPRPRRHARLEAPQARARRTTSGSIWGQGDGGGPAGDPDPARAARRPDLLGELHAARALRALRVGRRDLRRLDRRRRRRLAVDARPHRPRVARRSSSLPPTSSAPRPTRPTSRSRASSRTPARSAAAARRSSRPDGAYLAGPALRRGGDPLRRARPGASLGRAAAVRPGRPLPPARRARAPRHPERAVSTAVVVGAGVFGASTARELARRGWDVTVSSSTPRATCARAPAATRACSASRTATRTGTRCRRARALELWRELEARDRAAALRAGRRRLVRHGDGRLHPAERGRRSAGSASPCERLTPEEAQPPLPVARRRRSPLRALRARGRRALRARGDAGARRRPAASRPPDADTREPTGSRRRHLGLRLVAAEALPRARRAADRRGAMSSSSASAASGRARPASATTTAPTTVTASSAGSG